MTAAIVAVPQNLFFVFSASALTFKAEDVIIFASFAKRSILSLNRRQVMEEVKKSFPDKVFKTTIPRTVKLSEAPGFGKPISYFARFNKGTWAYKGLAKEIINNNERG